MYQNITKGIHELLKEANEVAKTISVKKAKLLLNDKDYVFIDLRDEREILRDGKIPCSFSCPRGMLEFWVDPKSSYHKKIFGKEKTYIFYCASAWRAALAVKTVLEMGLRPAVHIRGGFTEWLKGNGIIDKINK